MSIRHPLRTEEVVATYFRRVMLSRRWEGKEPLLRDIQDKIVYKLNSLGGIVKLRKLLAIQGIAGHGTIHAVLTKVTMSSYKNHSTLCSYGITIQRLRLSTCQMFHLYPSLAHWRRVNGTDEDGPFKNSSLLKSFSFTRRTGPYISMIALLIIKTLLRSWKNCMMRLGSIDRFSLSSVQDE